MARAPNSEQQQSPTAKLQSIIGHVVLPPKIPAGVDEGSEVVLDLVGRLLCSLNDLEKSELPDEDASLIRKAVATLKLFESSHDDKGCIREKVVGKLIMNLKNSNEAGILPLHVVQQNAGILVSKKSTKVVFELFELAPAGQQVTGSLGRLHRGFPDAAAAVSKNDVEEMPFQDFIGSMIEEMSRSSVPGMQKSFGKTGTEKFRDTTDPAIVTELFFALLCSHGEAVKPMRLWKHIREENLWSEGRKTPWRRSPAWLLLKIALEFSLRRPDETPKGNVSLYKKFMIYFHASLLSDAIQLSLSSELIHAMVAKIVRRLVKLAQPHEGWMTHVSETLASASQLLSTRWQDFIEADRASFHPITIDAKSVLQNIEISCPDLDKSLKSFGRDADVPCKKTFVPPSNLMRFLPQVLPKLPESSQNKKYQVFHLATFENWVTSHLEDWLLSNDAQRETCSSLLELMKDYHSMASANYVNNPEAISVMLLTLIQLWVACDKSATKLHPLLSEYDHEIPIESLAVLLLPFRQQMERLAEVEEYLTKRRNQKVVKESVLRSFGETNSFSVRFFDQSHALQSLKERIETDARQAQAKRRSQLEELQADWRSLKLRAKDLQCDTNVRVINGQTIESHKPSCRKCKLKKQAEALYIEIYEWPLPEEEGKAKSTVFELTVPQVFAAWRDATVFLLRDILVLQPQKPVVSKSRTNLWTYIALKDFNERPKSSMRIYIVSDSTPRSGRTRKDTINNIQETDVLVSSGLNWRYLDHQNSEILGGMMRTNGLSEMCTFKLEDDSKQLQPFLYRSLDSVNGPTPNFIISQQHVCPDHVSLSEFKALCSMNYGDLSIEQAGPALLCSGELPEKEEINHVDTMEPKIKVDEQEDDDGPILERYTAVAEQQQNQSQWQRKIHILMKDKRLLTSLLRELNNSLNRIRGNWDSCIAVGIFASVAARVLSFVNDQSEEEEQVKEFLTQCQRVCLEWLEIIRTKLDTEVSPEARPTLLRKARDIALIGMSTFSVGPGHLRSLIDDKSAREYLLTFAILIQETEFGIKEDDRIMQILAWKAKRVLRSSTRSLLSLIVHTDERCSCLDNAIRRGWRSFRPAIARDWRQPKKDSSWITTSCMTTNHKGHSDVNFDLLTGELLVNSVPLSGLPYEYEGHEVYRMLFGRSRLQVLPSGEQDMRFVACTEVEGRTIHFGVLELDHLPIRTCSDNAVYNLLPRKEFQKILPKKFVDDFVHWYNVLTGVVEFRDKATPLKSPKGGWKLVQVNETRHLWKLCKGQDAYLICHTSALAERLQQIFKPLEAHEGLHLIWNKQRRDLSINIPRLQLDFYIEEGSSTIWSQQFRDMTVDRVQGVGCLVGLRSKLVLRHKADKEDRIVLIPEGTVEWKEWPMEAGKHSHVQVSIKDDGQKLHMYRMNQHMGRLSDSGELPGKLLLAYLHALTSYVLPDPFTKHTGTEEALNILRSKSVQSAPTLSAPNITILEHIARLAPSRRAHPPDTRVTQMIKWDPLLTFQAQHGGLVCEVLQLFKEARRRSFLYPESPPVPDLSFVDEKLLERDLIRSSTFFVEGYGAELFTRNLDQDYDGRGRGQGSRRCKLAYEVARSLVKNRVNCLPRDVPGRMASAKILKNTLFSSCVSIAGVAEQHQHGVGWPLFYSSEWLKPMDEIIPDRWWALHGKLLHESTTVAKTKGAAWIASVAFMSPDDSDVVVLALLAITAFPKFSEGLPTGPEEFFLDRLDTIQKSCVTRIIKKARLRNLRDPQNAPERKWRETDIEYDHRCSDDFKVKQNDYVKKFIQHIMNQELEKPLEPPELLEEMHGYIEVHAALEEIRANFRIWADNRAFSKYLERLCGNLETLPVTELPLPAYGREKRACSAQDLSRFISMKSLLTRSASIDLPSVGSPHDLSYLVSKGDVSMDRKLVSVLEHMQQQQPSAHEKDYLDTLQRSSDLLQDQVTKYEIDMETRQMQEILKAHQKRAVSDFEKVYGHLALRLEDVERDDTALFCRDAGPWQMAMTTRHTPRVSIRTMIQLLQRDQWHGLSEGWKTKLIVLATSLSRLQRANRLVRAAMGDKSDLVRELRCQESSLSTYIDSPDQLLLEIDGDLTVRKQQKEIAEVMRIPPRDTNAVMQLNMGEGKSSVIIPLVAASLADGSRLLRVIVPKAQLRQMFDILNSKLGHLVKRRVYQLPFRRGLELSKDELIYINEMLEECKKMGGVLLVQPEHILSLHHTVIDFHRRRSPEVEGTKKQKDAQDEERKTTLRLLASIHGLFQNFARDIVDESDDVFSPRRELVYTIGEQESIDFSPDRWLIIQDLLKLVAKFGGQVKAELPQALVVDRRAHRFPQIRILKHEAWGRFRMLIIDQILENGLPGLPPVPRELRNDVAKYLSRRDMEYTERDYYGSLFSNTQGNFWTANSNLLYLLRGLLAGGVLRFALGKRWRVDFGLDPSRRPSTMLAVPFIAKDCPAPRSEFSHPDVVITLTCFCYYHGGLNDKGLGLAIDKLLMSDQADAEYRAWVDTSSQALPEKFRQLEGVNWDDTDQRAEVASYFRYSKATIDFMLSNIVFPKEMRAFPRKLSASGWDIGHEKRLPLTGFSGTNDARYVLPHTVRQLEVPDQGHTNAYHLETILQDENSVCLLTTKGHSGVPRALDIIRTVVDIKPETRVILDVGAQVLEMMNREVAKIWLERVKNNKVQAVVYVNDDDQLAVVDRRGRIDLLNSSPFRTQLDSCLVFLDEAHTRGTDLRLPSSYRAAVTLSVNLTKDRMVQACGRMRKLGQGQSVVFLVNEEVELKIRASRSDELHRDIEVADIVCWAIQETFSESSRSIRLWEAQGRRAAKVRSLLTEAGEDLTSLTPELADQFVEDDSKSLEARYFPSVDEVNDINEDSADPFIRKINEHCRTFELNPLDFDDFDDVYELEQNKQREQQLAPEIEQEAATERPLPAQPLTHKRHKDLANFIMLGRAAPHYDGFMWAFAAFRNPELQKFIPCEKKKGGLLVTLDFARSIQMAADHGISDDYQKPVRWVLTGGPEKDSSRHMIVISAFEANEFLREIKASKFVTLHVYSPRQNEAFAPLDNLQLYTVSGREKLVPVREDLRIELNIFAGQLYFKNYLEYLTVHEFLSMAPPSDDGPRSGTSVEPDRFIKVTDKEAYNGPPPRFRTSPVKGTKHLMTCVRRDFGAIDKTHMGKLLDGKVMSRDELEESRKRMGDDDVEGNSRKRVADDVTNE